MHKEPRRGVLISFVGGMYVAGAHVHLTDPQGLNAVHIAAVGREGSPQQCEKVMSLLLASAQQQGKGDGEIESCACGLARMYTRTHVGLPRCVSVSVSLSAYNRLIVCDTWIYWLDRIGACRSADAAGGRHASALHGADGARRDLPPGTQRFALVSCARMPA